MLRLARAVARFALDRFQEPGGDELAIIVFGLIIIVGMWIILPHL